MAGASANANMIYDLTVNGCSGAGGCSIPPYGEVQFIDHAGVDAYVTVIETLFDANFAGGGAGSALNFNIDKAVTVTAITPGFAYNPADPPVRFFDVRMVR